MHMGIYVDAAIVWFCKPDVFHSGYNVVKVLGEISVVHTFASWDEISNMSACSCHFQDIFDAVVVLNLVTLLNFSILK